jgi:hypothetical protein
MKANPLMGLALALALTASTVSGATLTVTTLADSGTGSLRNAIAAASTTSPGDDIVFLSGLTGTIMNVTELVINKPLTITGPGGSPGIAISGGSTVRCIHVGSAAPTAASTVTLTNLTLISGFGSVNGGGLRCGNALITLDLNNITVTGCIAQQHGGGLGFDNGTITVTRCTISGNSTNTGDGGGVYGGGQGATFSMTDCTVVGNTCAGMGGGWGGTGPAGSTLTFSACTFLGNTANGTGGGGLAIRNSNVTVTCNITNCTFSGNSAPSTAAASGVGGGVAVAGVAGAGAVTTNLTNCTFYGNTGASATLATTLVAWAFSGATVTINYRNTLISGAGTTNVGAMGSGTANLVSQDNNLCSDGTGNLSGANDLPNTNPGLGALANNGGPTMTHMPQAGSPAVDAGRAIGGVSTDQCGVAKPRDDATVTNASNGDGSDIGSVEALVPGDPEIDLSEPGGIGAIADGSTISGLALTASIQSQWTFRIDNLGSSSALNVTAITATPTGAANCNVSVVAIALPAAIGPASLATFDLQLTGVIEGPWEVTLAITSSDADEATYNVVFQGTAYGKEIDVRRAGNSIVDGGTSTVTGTMGATLATLTYDILNLSTVTGPLGLVAPNPVTITPVTNCSAVINGAQPSGPIASSNQVSFSVDVTPGVAGSWSFTISIANDDANENPYNFTVTGTASTGSTPEMDMFDGATPIADGGTLPVTGTVASVLSSSTLTIENNGPGVLILTGAPRVEVIGTPVNCTPNIATQPSGTINAGLSNTFNVENAPTAAGGWSFQISIANNDANENPYNFTVSGTASPAPNPEMDMFDGATPIVDGGTLTVSGSVASVVSSATLTIENNGSSVLNLTGTPRVQITGTPVNCTPVITTQPAATINAGLSDTFDVDLTPTTAGAFSFVISIDNNDPNENPYNFTVSGTAAAAPSAPIITSSAAPATAVNGVAYSHQFTATGNPSPTFAVTTGSLPGWATLTTGGLLSGTAVLGQDVSVIVSAQNGVGSDDAEVVTITVTAGVAPTIISAAPPTVATVGTLYTFTFTAAGTPTPTFSAVGLPVWLTLSPTTGLLSGTPAAGDLGTTGPITVMADNGVAPVATEVWSIVVSSGGGGGGGGGGDEGGGGCSTDDSNYGWPALVGLLSVLMVATRASSAKTPSGSGACSANCGRELSQTP